MRVLFDTNIVIDALNGLSVAGLEFDAADEHFISVISRIEVLAGCPTAESQRHARSVLTRMAELDLEDTVAEQAIIIRRSTRLKLPDAIILATARVHGLILSTRNTKDFRADDPEIRIPYEL